MAHIAILVHQNDLFERWGYFVHAFSELWRREGHRVSVLAGPGQHVDADLAVLHVDLTVTPPEYVAWAAKFPRVINGRVTDISKRRISRAIVAQGDGYAGPVVVKTDRNHGGQPEARMALEGTLRARIGMQLRDWMPWTRRSWMPSMEYRVYESAAAVPRGVWGNRELVIERFQPEIKDGMYYLRVWIFFGDRETHSLCYGPEPIVKSANIAGRGSAGDVPEDLRRIRAELGFDFGKFDYALVNGQAVLYDANRTPAMPLVPPEQYSPNIRKLAEGIRAYL